MEEAAQASSVRVGDQPEAAGIPTGVWRRPGPSTLHKKGLLSSPPLNSGVYSDLLWGPSCSPECCWILLAPPSIHSGVKSCPQQQKL